LCIDLTLFTLLASLTLFKLPKNLLPTSFGLHYNDHIRSSAIDFHNNTVDMKGTAILYVKMQKAMHGLLRRALLFYKKLVADLE
jgi:hypothetical protein